MSVVTRQCVADVLCYNKSRLFDYNLTRAHAVATDGSFGRRTCNLVCPPQTHYFRPEPCPIMCGKYHCRHLCPVKCNKDSCEHHCPFNCKQKFPCIHITNINVNNVAANGPVSISNASATAIGGGAANASAASASSIGGGGAAAAGAASVACRFGCPANRGPCIHTFCPCGLTNCTHKVCPYNCGTPFCSHLPLMPPRPLGQGVPVYINEKSICPWPEGRQVMQSEWKDPWTGCTYELTQNLLPPPNTERGERLPSMLNRAHPQLVAHQGYYAKPTNQQRIETNLSYMSPTSGLTEAKQALAGRPTTHDTVSKAAIVRGMTNSYVARDLYWNKNGFVPEMPDPFAKQRPFGFVGYQNVYRPEIPLPKTQELDLHRYEPIRPIETDVLTQSQQVEARAAVLGTGGAGGSRYASVDRARIQHLPCIPECSNVNPGQRTTPVIDMHALQSALPVEKIPLESVMTLPSFDNGAGGNAAPAGNADRLASKNDLPNEQINSNVNVTGPTGSLTMSGQSDALCSMSGQTLNTFVPLASGSDAGSGVNAGISNTDNLSRHGLSLETISGSVSGPEKQFAVPLDTDRNPHKTSLAASTAASTNVCVPFEQPTNRFTDHSLGPDQSGLTLFLGNASGSNGSGSNDSGGGTTVANVGTADLRPRQHLSTVPLGAAGNDSNTGALVVPLESSDSKFKESELQLVGQQMNHQPGYAQASISMGPQAVRHTAPKVSANAAHNMLVNSNHSNDRTFDACIDRKTFESRDTNRSNQTNGRHMYDSRQVQQRDRIASQAMACSDITRVGNGSTGGASSNISNNSRLGQSFQKQLDSRMMTHLPMDNSLALTNLKRSDSRSSLHSERDSQSFVSRILQ